MMVISNEFVLVVSVAALFVMVILYVMRRRSRLGRRKPTF
jgi:hypothetical protein